MTRRRKPWLPLATERLVLREFREADLDDIHAYGSDPEVSRFMLWGPNTPGDTRAFLDRQLEAQETWPRESVNMAVELEGRVIGATELRIRSEENRTAEFGYAYGRPWWRQGIAVEATRALLRLAFEELRMHRVYATADVRNIGSWRVMEKLGLRREALFRQDIRVKGRWRDPCLYAILASEYRQRLLSEGR